MEGNATYVRDTGELASDVPTETMFELFDPQKNFSKAKFTYTWDLGNGYEDFTHLKYNWRFGMLFFIFHTSFDVWCRKVIQGTEPVVRYHYSESGNYTLRLKVGVNVTKYAPLLTDVYSTEVQVLGLKFYINTWATSCSFSVFSLNFSASYSVLQLYFLE